MQGQSTKRATWHCLPSDFCTLVLEIFPSVHTKKSKLRWEFIQLQKCPGIAEPCIKLCFQIQSPLEILTWGRSFPTPNVHFPFPLSVDWFAAGSPVNGHASQKQSETESHRNGPVGESC